MAALKVTKTIALPFEEKRGIASGVIPAK